MAISADHSTSAILTDRTFSQALIAEMRSIRNRAALFCATVVVASTGLFFLMVSPCLYPTVTEEGTRLCTLALVEAMLGGDNTFFRETSGLLLGAFVATLLTVVFMRPSTDMDGVPMEAARGVLSSLATSLSLLTSVVALFWSASAYVRWAKPLGGADVHLMEIPQGVLIVVFCAFATTVLRPGLGVAVSNIRWAGHRIKSLSYWDASKRQVQARRADGHAALSFLSLIVSLVATKQYWVLAVDARNVHTPLILFLALSIVDFLVLATMKIHLSPDRKTHAFARALVSMVMCFYLFAVAAQAIPFWSAALISLSTAWFMHAASAFLAFASYEVSMPWGLSLRKSVEREMAHYQKFIADGQQLLGSPMRSPSTSRLASCQNPSRPSCLGSRCHSLATLTRRSR
jgi:hypothetical protein